MEAKKTPIDPSTFSLYAITNREILGKIINTRINHYVFGNGKIIHFEIDHKQIPVLHIEFDEKIGSTTIRKFPLDGFINGKFEFLSSPIGFNEKETYEIESFSSFDKKLQSLLNRFDFQDAIELFLQHPQKKYFEIYSLRFKQALINIQKVFEKSLIANDFPLMDDLYLKAAEIPDEHSLSIGKKEIFCTLKANSVQQYFSKPSTKVNAEQAKSIAVVAPNLLIKARAGSGKTRVIASKVALLVEQYKVNPDHIMVLAFNRKAANEISQRIKSVYGVENFENARTFHGLAYQIVQPKGPILFDEQGDFSRPALTNFVQEILRNIWTPEIQTLIYSLFRKEMQSLQAAGALLNNSDYVAYIKSLRDITLNGERVKSVGEKYIADFLFEHNIPYWYERVEFWSGHNYRPDFYLLLETGPIIVEFWGIDENDSQKRISGSWGISWDQYHAQMVEKRQYWKDQDIPLIEFSIVDTRNGRENFESILNTRLTNAGIKCTKLAQKEIEKKVIRKQKDRMTDLFVQFIQKAKKRVWSATEMQERVHNYQTNEQRTRIFLNLACQVFTEYEKRLAESKTCDFDELMNKAALKIEESKGACGVVLGSRKDRVVQINKLSWILIDEFQDFSQLFYNLLIAIQHNNPQVQLVCVGDDWQGINSFAGSDLCFFNDFRRFLPKSEVVNLVTNYRSQKAIVDIGNLLMSGQGELGRALPENNGGKVLFRTIDNIMIEYREGDEHNQDRENDQRFIFYEKRENGNKVNDNGFLQAKYLKACYQIIVEKDNWKSLIKPPARPDRPRIAILARTNQLHRVTLNEFLDKLKSCFSQEQLREIGDFRQKVRISTAHGFKGLEADTVIILRVCEGFFPLLHPDNQLFEVFGQTIQDALDEERRLFYVALTRAAEKLYLLAEKERESSFLEDINIRLN